MVVSLLLLIFVSTLTLDTMKHFQVEVIINEEVDKPLTISTIEAESEDQALDLAYELMFDQGNYNRDEDTVDPVSAIEVDEKTLKPIK